MKTWYHIDCFFALKKTKTSKTITSSGEIEGWDLLTKDDKDSLAKNIGSDFKVQSSDDAISAAAPSTSNKVDSKDNLFSEFQRIVSKIAREPSYNNKSQILQKYLREVRATNLFRKNCFHQNNVF